MDDLRISRLLGELPRHQASPFFTAGVLRRIRQQQQPASGSRPRRRTFAGATLAGAALAGAALASIAIVLLVSGLGLQELRQHREQNERQEAIARLESLEASKEVLEDEIQTLRRLARDAQPVVYLGSTPHLDVVVDLRRLADRRATSPRFVHHSNPRRQRP